MNIKAILDRQDGSESPRETESHFSNQSTDSAVDRGRDESLSFHRLLIIPNFNYYDTRTHRRLHNKR